MIDFHTHTLLSDGALLPAELVRRASVIGYKGIGLADHVDVSNIDFIVPRIVKAAKALTSGKIKVVAGVELTHVPPKDIAGLVKYARYNGIKLIIVHGETIAEPVIPGTNAAALECDIDILAHPGLISLKDAKTAAKHGVHLEISAKKGHSLTNGHVAKIAMQSGAKLVINTDSHEPGDLITGEMALSVLLGSGLTAAQAAGVLRNSAALLRKF
ncbi:MAG: histidinol phosphate phosphatase domain-containing protein [Candidatus Omnitrophota bacterium]|jgi:histidinol phosphatase-like PHP family hydrolase